MSLASFGPRAEAMRLRQAPLKQLAVAAGAEEDVTDLPTTVQVCVRADTTAVDARCLPLPPAS